jgi:hypothetical protein
VPAPPALEDPEAWPSPDVAATVEKDDKAIKPAPKETKETKEVEAALLKEPREGKKKKWEKLEVNFQYDPPSSRRGRGGKFYRNNNRQGSREGTWKGRDDRNEKEDSKGRRSEGEDRHPSSREGIDRRAQSLSFEAGHRSGTSPSAQFPVRGRASHDALRTNADHWRRTSSQSRSSGRNVSGPRSGSPGSPRDQSSAPIEAGEHVLSHPGSTNEQQATDVGTAAQHSHAGETTEESESQNQQNTGRRQYRGVNTFPQTSFPQSPYMTSPQQLPIYPSFYPPPMQIFSRSHSVPYSTNSPTRYSSYPQVYYPDFSRLGVQPVPIDEELKTRIVRQVYFPVRKIITNYLVNITSHPIISTRTCSCVKRWIPKDLFQFQLSCSFNVFERSQAMSPWSLTRFSPPLNSKSSSTLNAAPSFAPATIQQNGCTP